MGKAGIKTVMPMTIKIIIRIADRISLNIFYLKIFNWFFNK